MSIKVEKRGDLFLITGYTYPIKDQLKSVGCKWNKRLGGWTTDNIAVARDLRDNPPKETVEMDAKVVIAKALHKEREYPVIHRKGEGAKLAFTDGTAVFWVKSVEKILETYDPAISLEDFDS